MGPPLLQITPLLSAGPCLGMSGVQILGGSQGAALEQSREVSFEPCFNPSTNGHAEEGCCLASGSCPWEHHAYGRPPPRDSLSLENLEHLGYVDVQTDSISVREEGEHDPVWLHL